MRARFLLPIVVLSFTLTSCAEIASFLGLDKDYFADYRGKNLLSNYGFDAVDASSNPKWAITTPAAYMTWEVPTDGAPTVGPDGTPAYRLEIKSLIPDGDFEETTNGPTMPSRSFWAPKLGTGGTSPVIVMDTSFTMVGSTSLGGTKSISNRSLEWDAVAGGNRLQLDLQSALGALWVSNVKYRIRFDFINFSTGPSFETYLTASTTDWANDSFAENGGRWGDAPTPQDKTTINQVSFFFTLPSPTPQRFLNLGPPIAASSAAFKGLFDNVRLLQADQNAWVRADLTSLSSGSLKLLPGSKSGAYTFTVWVRDDPTADQSGTSPTHALNRFYPQGLMIQLTAKVKSGTGNDPRFFPRPSSGWTAWTKLTLPFGFDFVANDSDLGTDPALRVEFTPTETQTLDYGGRDVGSLLLASPSLQFNP